jgi:MFS family permease
MPAQRPPTELRRNLRACVLDGSGVMVMVGAGETYFPALALALGMGEVEAGLVATIPMLLGGALQLVSPWAVERLGSLRRWVILTCTAQALSFAPLVALALAGHCSVPLLYGFVALYWASGFAAGPAWTTWIETLVPRRIFARFFGYRTALLYAAFLVTVLGCGVALQAAREHDVVLPAFAVILAVAGLARLFSVRMLLAQTEPVAIPPGMRHLSMRELAGRLRTTDGGRFLAFLLVAQTSIQVAQPFVSPYLLERMRMPYWAFAVLASIPLAVRIVAAGLLGRVAHARGPRSLMWIGMAAMVPASALWLVPGGFWWVAFVQVVVGIAFTAYELGTWLVWVDAIPAAERTSVLTTYFFWNSVAVVAGSIVGSMLLASGALCAGGYGAVFLVSAVLRLAALALFGRSAPRAAPATVGPAPSILSE